MEVKRPSKTTFTKRLEANPSAQMVVYLDCALGFVVSYFFDFLAVLRFLVDF
jgi:hypothetical protein